MRTLPLAVLLAGCAVDLPPDHGLFNVHSSSGTMTIEACATSGIFGCEQGSAASALSAVIDGANVAIPAKPASYLPTYDHELVVPSPQDPHIELVDGTVAVAVEELPSFEVHVPDAASRANGLQGTFQVYPDAVIEIMMTTTCGPIVRSDELTAPDGNVSIAFPPLAGPCTHDLAVTQTMATTASVHVGRTQFVTITTTD
jgi:hypothetical protein